MSRNNPLDIKYSSIPRQKLKRIPLRSIRLIAGKFAKKNITKVIVIEILTYCSDTS